MGRAGITNDQIKTAIDALQTRGEVVNKNTVRRELGNTGSFGTITAYLKSWRAEQDQDLSTNENFPCIPESVLNHFGRIWATAQAVAEAELAPQREALAQEAAAIKAVLERNQAENDEALHMLEIEIDGLRAQLSDASNREEKTLARLEETSQALGYAKAKLDATEQEHRHKISEMETKITHLEDQLKSKYTTRN